MFVLPPTNSPSPPLLVEDEPLEAPAAACPLLPARPSGNWSKSSPQANVSPGKAASRTMTRGRSFIAFHGWKLLFRRALDVARIVFGPVDVVSVKLHRRTATLLGRATVGRNVFLHVGENGDDPTR